ncbi:hypothetical protein BRETT_001926 [Brettanomyces bruxellensis]|uniref:NADP-dependent oxidoreductase domain-containing protein n=1 Tax=Dekkera bruxellensis TaxID=5007 RepID=A0A871RFJ4_DEKBR|nr:uncharacterized protein BRETT_001926 [Brettanomyces bruxellensis]QOU21762.1 hypothetical protein BRETT_001926 [Brettanomyces bruxellensis]
MSNEYKKIPIEGPTGYGTMSLTMRSERLDNQDCFDAINKALEQGITFFNVGEFYGDDKDRFLNLKLFREYFAKYPQNRDKMTISVKGAIDPNTFIPSNTPEELTKSIKHIASYFPDNKFDIFEPARMDNIHSPEEVFSFLKRFVDDGTIKGLSISEVNGKTVSRALSVFPALSCVEVEYSMMQTDILTNGVNDVCRKHGIPIIAYSPLGRGYLTGSIRKIEDIPKGDFRRSIGRMSSDEVLKANFAVVKLALDYAEKKNCTAAQIALAWIRKHNEFPEKYAHIVPIPSGSSVKRVTENSTLVKLTDEEFADMNEKISKFDIKGLRYNEYEEQYLNL